MLYRCRPGRSEGLYPPIVLLCTQTWYTSQPTVLYYPTVSDLAFHLIFCLRTNQQPWDVPVDLFFYREPEELEKAEEAQAPFQDPQAVAAPGWGADPIVAGAAPTPMEGFAPVDPNEIPMEYQAPAAEAGLAGWDAAPSTAEVTVEVDQPGQDGPVVPVDAAVPVDAGVRVEDSGGGGWDAAPQQTGGEDGGWGDSSGAAGGGW